MGVNPCAIVAADLNGDNLPDLVTADRGIMSDPSDENPAGETLSILLAEEGMKYQARPPLHAGFGPWCIAVANMDALKAPDLVVGNFHAARKRHLSVFLNKYAESQSFEQHDFTVPEETVSYARNRDIDDKPIFTVPGITALTVQRFDDDAFRDVIATGWASDVLIFFPGDPDNCLASPRLIPALGGPCDIQAADFDKDGHEDLVTTMLSSAEIVLWQGDGKGLFQEAQRLRSQALLPHKVRVADMDLDGQPDLVVSHRSTDDVISVHYGSGEFSFDLTQEIVLGKDRKQAEHEIRDLLVADLNGDKRPDIAVACYASAQVNVFMNVPDKKRGIPRFTQETYTYANLSGQPRALCAADLNQDDKTDLAIAMWEANAIAFLIAR